MSDNFLQLNNKTETIIVALNNVISPVRPCIGSLTKCVQHNVRNLGVIFDQALSFENHVSLLTRTCYAQFRNIANLRSVVSKAELEMIIHAFISSRLDYANALFTCVNKSSLVHLQTIQHCCTAVNSKQQEVADLSNPVLLALVAS